MIAVNPVQPVVRPRQSMRWPMIIVGLLVGHVLLMMTAVFVISRNNRDGIIPDHYEKSLNWDRSHADSGPQRIP